LKLAANRPTILLIPGIQGRWEWMQPAISALSSRHRVLTFSLNAIPSDADCFNEWERLIDRLLDDADAGPVAAVGVSFGGLVALRYASRRAERVRRLVLVSAPAPGLVLDARRAAYVRHPLLLAPLFALRGIAHLLPEVAAARPAWTDRAAFLLQYLARAVRYPASLPRMAAWARAWPSALREIQCALLDVPTLVITGEPQLDRVVDVATTLEYLNLLPNATHAVLPGTGHIGLVTRPQAFARLVGEFVNDDVDVSRAGGPSRGAAG
jgi:pimeloyl-ACP methyl ester carboxylesterase